MSESSNKVTILVAIIGLLGTIGTAVISNWEKIVGHPERSEKSTQPPASEANVLPARRVVGSAPPVKSVAGTWIDSKIPSNGSRITQEGNRIRFTGSGINVFGNPYQTTGTGTVNGDAITMSYTARDRTGTSGGNCSGTLSSNASQMTLTCTDSAIGTFVFTAIRQ